MTINTIENNSLNLNNRPYKKFTKSDAIEIQNLAKTRTHNDVIENTNYIFEDEETGMQSIYSGAFLRAYYLYDCQIHNNKKDTESED